MSTSPEKSNAVATPIPDVVMLSDEDDEVIDLEEVAERARKKMEQELADAKKRKDEIERKRKVPEDRKREVEDRKRQEDMEAERKKKADEEAAQKRVDDEAVQKRVDDEAAKQKGEAQPLVVSEAAHRSTRKANVFRNIFCCPGTRRRGCLSAR